MFTKIGVSHAYTVVTVPVVNLPRTYAFKTLGIGARNKLSIIYSVSTTRIYRSFYNVGSPMQACDDSVHRSFRFVNSAHSLAALQTPVTYRIGLACKLPFYL